jgi:uncharacterized protein (DUF433 family)
MTKSQLKLMVNVFRRRINQGETFEEIAEDYPKLTTEDLEQIRAAL